MIPITKSKKFGRNTQLFAFPFPNSFTFKKKKFKSRSPKKKTTFPRPIFFSHLHLPQNTNAERKIQGGWPC